MQLVEQHVIAKSDPRYALVDEAAFKSKNLYNAANYEVRQSYIHEGKYLNYHEMDRRMQTHEAYLDANCNEFLPALTVTCGDWVPLGNNLVDSTYGTDKAGSYVVAITRAPSDNSTMWVATRLGRLFISTNADATDASSVNFTRIDTSAQPDRFISGIAVDPKNPYHAFVSFSGYNAYTPTTTGHVFDVLYNPQTGTATWTDISHNLGDAPITSIAYDSVTGDLYASNDFGVLILRKHSNHWRNAAPNLPMVAVYGLTLSANGHVLYAATHGRGIWRLNL